MEGALKDLVRTNPQMFRSLLQEMASDAGPSSSGVVNPSSPELKESDVSNSTDGEESELEDSILSESDDDMQDSDSSSGGAPAPASAPAVKVHKILNPCKLFFWLD